MQRLCRSRRDTRGKRGYDGRGERGYDGEANLPQSPHKIGTPMSNDSERWLLKALHEAAGELRQLLVDALLNDTPDAPTLIRQAWQRETIAGWQLAHLIFHDLDQTDPLPLHSLEWLEQRPDQLPDPYEQIRQLDDLRSQITAVLAMLAPAEWSRSAHHRFQGNLSVRQIARALHQHDLELLTTLRPHTTA